MNEFDLSQFEVKTPSTIPMESKPESSDFNLSEFEVGKKEESDVKRHAARTGARVVETVLGFPGDIVQISKMIGEKLPQLSSVKEPSFIQKKGKQLLESIPSSEDLKKFSSYITSGFTDPQSAQEQFGDEIASLGTALLMPAKNPAKFTNLLKSFGTAAVTKGVGVGVETLGGTEKQKNLTELGTLFLTGWLTNNFLSKFISEKYKQAFSHVPPGTIINTTQLSHDLNKTYYDLSKGLPKTSTTKSEVLKSVDELRDKVVGHQTPVEELIESYKDINEKLRSKKLFEDLSSTEKKLLKSRYDLLKNDIDSELRRYGVHNPKFYNTWKEANSAYSVLAQSKSAKEWIMSNIKTIPGHVASSMAIKFLMGIPTRAAAGAGVAAYQTGKVLTRMMTNPTLRKYYIDTAKSAMKENLPAFIKNIKKFDKKLSEENFNLEDLLRSQEKIETK